MISNREFINDNFYLPKDLLYFNAGTFGICPKPVLEEKIRVLREIESNPALGFFQTLFDSVIENQKVLAQRIGVDYQNMALVENVTQGIGSVLHSIDVKTGDEILLINYVYTAIRMSVEEIFVKRGGIIRTVELKTPFESLDQIVDVYVTFVKRYPRIKYAIIDHIPSALPMVQPVKQITRVLREKGIFVIIDGAHCPGHLKNLNVLDIDADVYVGNLHKWCFTPRGVAFIAKRPDCQLQISPPFVSFLHYKSFYERFLYSGTFDMSNSLCIKKAFEFIDSLGGFEEINRYNSELLERGVAYIENNWNVISKRFPETAPCMRLVPFPEGFEKHRDKIIPMIANPFERPYYKFTYEKLGFIASAFVFEEKLHFRLCSQIFLEYEHFVKFSKAVLRWLEILDNNETM